MRLRCNNNSLYKIFIFILILMYMIETTSLKSFNESTLQKILQLSALFFAFIYIVKRKYSHKELERLFVLNSIGLLCYISSGFSGLFMTMLAITLLPQGILDDVLKMIFKEELVLFAIIVVCSCLGILNNSAVDINKGSYVASALSLGFEHPNMLAAQATSIVFLYLCINRKQLRMKHFLFSLLSIIAIFFISKGRTSLILGVLAWLLILMKNKRIVKKYILRILPWIYILVFAVLILCMIIYAKFGYNARITILLNDTLFNGRIGLAYRSLLVYPITLFGKAIDLSVWNKYQYYSLDNGQVMLLLEYGIIGFMAYFFVIQKATRKIQADQETVLGIVMIIFLVWSMYEGTMYFIGKNFALLFLGTNSQLLAFSRQRRKYDS